MYLKQNYDLLVMFDMLNSVSNIILHCLCGKRFRNELRRMLRSFLNFLKHLSQELWCCYVQIRCPNFRHDRYTNYSGSITRHESSNSSTNASHKKNSCLKIQSTPKSHREYCCDCRWYFNRKPLTTTSQQHLTTMSKECSQKNQTSYAVRYQSITQRTNITKQTQAHSMRLYHPPQETSSTKSVNKNLCLSRR
jgi:hypothetical protein